MNKIIIRIVLIVFGIPILKLWFSSLHFDKKIQKVTPRVIGFWHQDIFCSLALLRRQLMDRSIVAIVSSSSDGDILKIILNGLGIDVLQGSSSNRGFEVLLEAARSQHEFILITPDGPKGPSRVMKDGIYKIAEIRKMPISFLGFSYSVCKRLSSWDQFVVPMPFSKCYVTEIEHSLTEDYGH